MIGRMNRTIAALFAALLAAAPAEAAERSYSVTDFDRIQVEGPFEVTLATGLSSRLRASGPADALDRLSVEVEGRTLRIRVDRSAWGGTPGRSPGPVRIEATTHDLVRASVLGAGSLAVDKARGLRIDLSVGGSGHLAVAALDADQLVVGLVGSGRIGLAGHARQMRAIVQGSGDLDAAALRTEDVQLSAETAGTIAIGSARSAKVVAAGLGDIAIGGSPACTVDNRGSGRVRCGS
ncbi:MAG: hypothetical protein QOH81_841 [Sphingomonadales bacterium]|jgi:hypothetical protein|nr:hypothetical protein [Sphingomonadales bacterium]